MPLFVDVHWMCACAETMIRNHRWCSCLQEQYSGIRTIFRKCFALLKVMARGNDTVQHRLFDRLDMLLNIQGAEPEMAEALVEVRDQKMRLFSVC